MSDHSVSNLDETGDVGTLNIVDVTILFSTIFHAVSMDAVHDAMQFFVNFFASPSSV